MGAAGAADAARDGLALGAAEETAGEGFGEEDLLGVVLSGLALCQGPWVPASAVPNPTPRATITTAVMATPTVSFLRLAAIR